jgi:hypothetical protein
MTKLFSEASIFDVLENQKLKIKTTVNSLDRNYLLNASEEDLIRALVDELSLQVPAIVEEGVHMEYEEADIDVSGDPMRMIFDRNQPFYIKGVRVTISVPFDGDGGFLVVRPQSFTWQGSYQARVTADEIQLVYTRTDHDGAAIKREFDTTLRLLRQNLASLKASVDQFNGQLDQQVRQLVRERKTKLLADAHMAASIGIPIKRRDGMPTTYSVPVQRRKPKIERPPASASKFQPEPALAMEEYENILTIVRNMVRVMEQSPKAFEKMGEEDLRTHFLVQLNGQYEGRATGETFNFQGKTDILIREEGRNVFIAECKFWHGEKQFLETIDQLLSYLSWRDTKVAVFLFNRNANFSDVLNKIGEVVPKHGCFKRDLGKRGESEFRYIFCHPDDPNRELVLTVLAFDVPTEEHRSKPSA